MATKQSNEVKPEAEEGEKHVKRAPQDEPTNISSADDVDFENDTSDESPGPIVEPDDPDDQNNKD